TTSLMRVISTKCPLAIVLLLLWTDEGGVLDILHTVDMVDIPKNELTDWFQEHGKKIQQLNLSRSPSINDEMISSVVTYCPRLQKLKLNECYRIGDASISLIAQTCPDLQVLDLEGCEISNASISLIAQNCSKLRLLVLNAKLGTAGLLQVINTKCL